MRASASASIRCARLGRERRVQRDEVGALEQRVERHAAEASRARPPCRTPRRGARPPARCGPAPTTPSVAPRRRRRASAAGSHVRHSPPRTVGGASGRSAARARAAARRRGRRWRRSARRACCRPGCRAPPRASRSMLSVPDRVVGDRPQPRRGVEQLGVDAVGEQRTAGPRPRRRARAARSGGGGSRPGQTSTSCCVASRAERVAGQPPGDRRGPWARILHYLAPMGRRVHVVVLAVAAPCCSRRPRGAADRARHHAGAPGRGDRCRTGSRSTFRFARAAGTGLGARLRRRARTATA